MNWRIDEYGMLGQIGGWYIACGNNGSRSDHVDRMFIPMKWDAVPPICVADIVDTLNAKPRIRKVERRPITIEEDR